MAWFKRIRRPIAPSPDKAVRVPEGLWVKCPGCQEGIYNKDLAANLHVCPSCAHHFRVSAIERLRMLFDAAWQEHDRSLVSTDPLLFTDTGPYKERLAAGLKATGQRDAVVTATGRIEGIEAVVGSMEYGFIGGSMGVVVGEKLTRAIERAITGRLPVLQNPHDRQDNQDECNAPTGSVGLLIQHQVTKSADKNDLWQHALGADLAIQYRENDFVTAAKEWAGGLGLDVAFDNVGAEAMLRTFKAMAPYGRVVTLMGTPGDTAETDAYNGNLTIRNVMMLTPMWLKLQDRLRAQADHIREGLSLVASGKLRVVVDRVFPLGDAPAANDHLESGRWPWFSYRCTEGRTP